MSIRVRAITLALPHKPQDLLKSAVFEESKVLCLQIKESLREFPLPIISFRIALKPIEEKDLVQLNAPKILSSMNNLILDTGYDYLSLPIIIPAEVSIDVLESFKRWVNAFRNYENIFLSLNIKEFSLKDIPKIAGLYSYILDALRRSMDYPSQTRISLTLKGPIMTPYFPSGACLREKPGIMVALLYPNFLMGNIRLGIPLEKAILQAYNLVSTPLSRCIKEINIPFYGIDLSISPWMEESVIPLLDIYRKSRGVSEPSYFSILSVNEILRNVASKIKSIGFNEVMLPLAEDNELKRLVQHDLLRVRDFIALSALCVAGVDMIPLPRSDLDVIRGIIADMLSIAMIKPRPMGIRLILTNEAPGVLFKLWHFEETPVPKF